MSLEQYIAGLAEQYQGEVIGEVAQNCLLKQFRNPRQQYVMGTALQLETETKARLRPAATALGIDIVEAEESREMGLALAEMVKHMDWQEAMSFLAEAVLPYVEKYRQIAENAPPDLQDLAQSMVEHEHLLQQLYEQEATQTGDDALEEINRLLTFPLPKPG